MSDWIEWTGGENPVPGKMVNIRQRGYANDDLEEWEADYQPWETKDYDPQPWDIIAYRLASPPSPQPADHIGEGDEMIVEGTGQLSLLALKRLTNDADYMLGGGGLHLDRPTLRRRPKDIAADLRAALSLIARQQETIRADGEAMRAVLPGNIGDNPNIPDDMVLPCDITMGEIRMIRARLSARQGCGS